MRQGSCALHFYFELLKMKFNNEKKEEREETGNLAEESELGL